MLPSICDYAPHFPPSISAPWRGVAVAAVVFCRGERPGRPRGSFSDSSGDTRAFYAAPFFCSPIPTCEIWPGISCDYGRSTYAAELRLSVV